MKNRVNTTITLDIKTVERLDQLKQKINVPISRILEDCFLEKYGD